MNERADHNIDNLSVSSRFFEARLACLNHADDLLCAAKALHEKDLPNIAYHLATLALEEIGKAGLFVIYKSQNSEVFPAWPVKHALDHVKKLFWAFFGGSFGRQVITDEMMRTHQELAKAIHERRIQGLYVDLIGEKISIPSTAISKDEAGRLIELAFARLQLEKSIVKIELSDSDSKLLSWFLQSAEDPEISKFIFSRESMEMLAEKKLAISWIAWLKERYEADQQENIKLAESELRRPRPEGVEAKKNKWQLRVRLFSASHSIRPKALNSWNDTSNWIKLYPVDGRKHKNELIVEFLLPKAVQINQLWLSGWGAAKRFVTALNIGSLGYFWWHLPQQVSRYYESLIDLEMRSEVRIERSPILSLNWGNKALEKPDLVNAMLCFVSFPNPSEETRIDPFNYYIGGLTFLGINDIHWQCEENAYLNFYQSLKKAMRVYGDYKEGDDFLKSLKNYYSNMLDESTIDECYALGECLEDQKNGMKKKITLEEVGGIKVLCDAYFLQTFRKHASDLQRKG